MKKNLLIFFILFLTFSHGKASFFKAEGPSFKCSATKTPLEKVICGSECMNQRLGDFDNLLSALYKIALVQSKNPKTIEEDQKIWIAKNQSTDCYDLLDSYDKRIRHLLQDKNLLLHLCKIVFSPDAHLNNNMLLGRDPSYVFCNEIPILEKPNFFLNQLLISYITQALVTPIEIDLPTDLGGTESYRVNDNSYLVAFSSSSGAHNHTYDLFLVSAKNGEYEAKQLKIPYFDIHKKQIKLTDQFVGTIVYNSQRQVIEMNDFKVMMEGYTTFEYELKKNELILIQQQES